jgi:hypothetical protein
LSAQHRAMTKLLLLATGAFALANALASAQSQPPLLIDSAPAASAIDAQH